LMRMTSPRRLASRVMSRVACSSACVEVDAEGSNCGSDRYRDRPRGFCGIASVKSKRPPAEGQGERVMGVANRGGGYGAGMDA
jgi:hypothetical protein